MSKTVSQKMGLKEGMRAFFQNAPASALRAMKLPELNARQTLRGEFDYLHLFTTSQAEMDKVFPELMRHLKQIGYATQVGLTQALGLKSHNAISTHI